MIRFYNHPLTGVFVPDYSNPSVVQQPLNVLVVGSDDSQFDELDKILQYGQAPYAELHLLVVNDKPGQADRYLDDPRKENGDAPTRRERLKNFVTIGKVHSTGYSNGETSCGVLNFLDCLSLSSHENEEYVDDVLEAIQNFNPDFKPHYVVVILSDQNRNREIANRLAERFSATKGGHATYVRYLASTDDERNDGAAVPYVVHENDDIQTNTKYAELRRWAFNIHMIWNPRPSIKIKSLLYDFYKDKANFRSCFSAAIGLKTRLCALGIRFDRPWNQIAAEISDKLERNENNILEQLCNAQHRRFVMHKLLEGYRPYTFEEAAELQKDKDNTFKRHLCLKRASLDLEFAKKRFSELTEKDAVDSLEKDNLAYYRAMQSSASKIDRQELLGDFIDKMLPLIKSSARLVDYFRSLCLLLQLVFDGDYDKVSYYEHALDDLKKTVETSKSLTEINKEKINRLINRFDRKVAPIIRADGASNYRCNDYRIAKGVPFILTHSLGVHLFIPYSTEPKDAMENIASVTVINPARVTYMFLSTSIESVGKLLRSFEKTLNYFRHNSLTQNIRLAIVLDYTIANYEEIRTRIEEGLRDIRKRHPRQKGRIAVKYLGLSEERRDDHDASCDELEEFDKWFKNELNAQSNAAKIIARKCYRSSGAEGEGRSHVQLVWWQKNDTRLADILSEIGEFNGCQFEFISKTGEFKNYPAFNYIPKRRYFGSNDLRVLKRVFPSYTFFFRPKDKRAELLLDNVVSQQKFGHWWTFVQKLIKYDKEHLDAMARDLRDDSEVAHRVNIVFKTPDANVRNQIETFLDLLKKYGFITAVEKEQQDRDLYVYFYYSNRKDKELILNPAPLFDARYRIFQQVLSELQKPVEPIVNEVARNLCPAFDEDARVDRIDFILFSGFRSVYVNCVSLDFEQLKEYAKEFKKVVERNSFNATPALIVLSTLTENEIDEITRSSGVKLITEDGVKNFAQRIRDILAATTKRTPKS